MKKIPHLILFLVCLINMQTAISQGSKSSATPGVVKELQLLDSLRGRKLPVVLSSKTDPAKLHAVDVVIFSPGTGVGIDYKSYTYLTEHLSKKGYLVISVQHNLPSDVSGQTADEFTVTRSPNWEAGVMNIEYLIENLPVLYPGLKIKSVTLIGHSNGGDISMLYATQHPEKLSKVISLDNRRIPIPSIKSPIICSIRSSEEPPHEDLLPTKEAIVENKMRIIYLKNIKHNDMDQSGSQQKHDRILKAVDACMSARWRTGAKNGFNTVTDDL